MNALFYLWACMKWSGIGICNGWTRKRVNTVLSVKWELFTIWKPTQPIWLSSKSFVCLSLSGKCKNKSIFIAKKEKPYFISWKINQNCIKWIRFVACKLNVQWNHTKRKTTTNKCKMKSFKVIYNPLCAT